MARYEIGVMMVYHLGIPSLHLNTLQILNHSKRDHLTVDHFTDTALDRTLKVPRVSVPLSVLTITKEGRRSQGTFLTALKISHLHCFSKHKR